MSVAEEPPAAGEELVGERTATSKTFATDEVGVFESVLFAEPVHFQEGEGLEWTEIGTDLVPGEDGRVVNEANAFEVSIARDASESDLVRVDLGGDAWVAWGLQTPVPQGTAGRSSGAVVPASEGEVEGDTITFDEVVPEVGLELTSRPAGVKEDLVLAGPDAPVEYAFAFTVAGVEVVEAGDGVEFRDAEENLVASIPAGFMVDEAGEVSGGVTMALEALGEGEFVVHVSLDPEWLGDPARAFPVQVDPTVELTTGVDDTHVESARPNTNFAGYTSMRVGRDASGVNRGFIQFDTSALDGKTINYADLRVFGQHSASCTATDVTVHAVTQAWTGAQVRWPGPGIGDLVGTVQTAAGGGAACPAGWVPIRISQVVRDWTSGTLDNHGVSLRASETSTAAFKTFATTEAAAARRPQLRVNWRESLLGSLGYYTVNSAELTDRTRVHNNVANGNLMIEATDLALPGVAGTGVGFTRFYNSREDTAAARRGMTGTGWTMSLGQDIRLSVSAHDKSALFEGPSGYTIPIRYNPATGTYEQPVGLNATLMDNNPNGSGFDYTLTFHETDLDYHFVGSPKLSRISDRSGNDIDLGYTGEELTSVTDTKGDTILLTYTAAGLLSTITDADNRTVTYGYAGDNLASVTDPAGKTTNYTYDTESNLRTVVDPNGKTTRFTYDVHDRLRTLTWADSSLNRPAITEYTYPADTLVYMDDQRDNRWSYRFDEKGRLSRFSSPRSGAPETYAYNAFNAVQDYTTNSGGIGTLTYDGYNVLTIQSDNGAQSEFEYNDPNSDTKPSTYTDPRGVALNYTYNDREQMTSVTSDNGGVDATTTITYRTPAQSCSGEIAKTVDAEGNTTSYAYDARCRLTKIDRPAPAGDTTLTYDALDRVRQVTDGNGNRQVMTYDKNDRVTEITYYEPGSVIVATSRTSYTYDGNGNRTSRTDWSSATGTRTSTWTLDARNRVLTETLPQASNSYAYDVAGNLTSMTTPAGTTTYTYDSENDVTTLTPPAGPAIDFDYYEHTYAAVEFPNNVTDAQHYDKDGRIATIDHYRHIPGSGTLKYSELNYNYTDPDTGNKTNSVYSIHDDPYDYEVTYTYDTAGRITSSHGQSGQDVFEDTTYTYDNNSNRTQWTTHGSTYTAQYNAANQLTTMTRPGGTTVTFTYDTNGNLTSDSRGTDLEHNEQNKTTSITHHRNSGTTNTSTYNGNNQVERTQYGTTTFTNSILGVTSATTPAGTTHYYRAPDGRVLGQVDPDGRIFYYLTDRLGSITGITNQAGSRINDYGYDPYGAYTYGADGSVGGTRPLVNWRYTGQWLDGTTVTGNGYYKIGLRYYDQTTGRWTQTDPLERITNPTQPPETNPYAYAGCNPTNQTDPSGAASVLEGISELAGGLLGCITAGYAAGEYGGGVGFVLGGPYGAIAGASIGAVYGCAGGILLSGISGYSLDY